MKYFRDRFEAKSAGIEPTEVNPYAIRVLQEIGVETKNLYSKHLKEFTKQHFDYIITLCDELKEHCPVFLGDGKIFHWDIKDPAEFKGNENEKLMVFRKTRDELKKRIEQFVEEIK